MGQQQLLLLVIGVVLVGIATVTAFVILDHYYRKDEADGLLERSLAIATHAAYWKTKNDAFAGGNQSYERLYEMGIEGLGLADSNVRGRFGITAASQNTLEITGVSDRYPEVGVRVFVRDYDIDRSEISYDGDFTLPSDPE